MADTITSILLGMLGGYCFVWHPRLGLGFFIGWCLSGMLGFTDDSKIKSGKPFKVDDATYQCVITNKLKGL